MPSVAQLYKKNTCQGELYVFNFGRKIKKLTEYFLRNQCEVNKSLLKRYRADEKTNGPRITEKRV